MFKAITWENRESLKNLALLCLMKSLSLAMGFELYEGKGFLRAFWIPVFSWDLWALLLAYVLIARSKKAGLLVLLLVHIAYVGGRLFWLLEKEGSKAFVGSLLIVDLVIVAMALLLADPRKR